MKEVIAIALERRKRMKQLGNILTLPVREKIHSLTGIRQGDFPTTSIRP
jgi:hypothetical protein